MYPTECRVPENSKKRKEGLLKKAKKAEENNRTGRTTDLFQKIGDFKGICHARMGRIKNRIGMDLTEIEEIKMRWQEYTRELYKKKRY